MSKFFTVVIFLISRATLIDAQVNIIKNDSNVNNRRDFVVCECINDTPKIVLNDFNVDAIQFIEFINPTKRCINNIPDSFFMAEYARIISDSIVSISHFIDRFNNAIYLELVGLGFSEVPNEIFNIKPKILSFTRTSIKKLPKRMKRLNLYSLDISNCQISSIPKWFKKLDVANSLTLRNTGVKYIDASILNIKSNFVKIIEKEAVLNYSKDDTAFVYSKEHIELCFINIGEYYEFLISSGADPRYMILKNGILKIHFESTIR